MDITAVLSGTFTPNGFKTSRATNHEEAVKILDEDLDNVDSVLVDGTIAADRQAMSITKVKEMKPEVKIFVVTNNMDAKVCVLEYDTDEFTIKPMNAKILANNMLTLLSYRKRLREK